MDIEETNGALLQRPVAVEISLRSLPDVAGMGRGKRTGGGYEPGRGLDTMNAPVVRTVVMRAKGVDG